jgi:hypothetical protein
MNLKPQGRMTKIPRLSIDCPPQKVPVRRAKPKAFNDQLLILLGRED